MSEWLILHTPEGWRVQNRWDHYTRSEPFATKAEAEAWIRRTDAEFAKLLRGLPDDR